jgi:hypothetical protein
MAPGPAVVAAEAVFAACHAYQRPQGMAAQTVFAVTFGVAFLLIRRVWPLALGHALCNIALLVKT